MSKGYIDFKAIEKVPNKYNLHPADIMNKWHKVEQEGLPSIDGDYLTCEEFNGYKYYMIRGFSLDAYSVDDWVFESYKGKNKPIFYAHDGEFGCYDVTDDVKYWMEIPKVENEI